MWINFWIGLAPSTSAASYKLCGIACNLAKINRKASGNYRQISKKITVVKANLNLNSKPKILITIYFWPNKLIGCSMILKLTYNAFKVPLLGSSNKVHV